MRWSAALRAVKGWLATARPSQTTVQTSASDSRQSLVSSLEKHRVAVAGVGAMFVLGSATVLVVSHVQADKPWLQVYRNGTYIGLVPNRSDVTSTMRRIADGYHVQYRTVPIHTNVSSSYNWRRVASFPTPAAEIQVDGKPVIYTTSLSAANDILHNVEQTFAAHPANATKVTSTFIGNVKVSPVTVGVADIVDSRSATQQLIHPVDYHLAGRSSGPSLHTVADNASLNPVAGATKPVLSVKSNATVSQTVKVKYPIKYVDDNYLAKGVNKVVHKGQDGSAKELVSETYVNGDLVSSHVVQKEVVKKPVTAVVDRGVNAGVATGHWVWPTVGHIITSPYGWRFLFGARQFHPGIDIGVPTGTPIYATNDGVVMSAGWNNGGYGNWVEIDNGHGITTIFGHMSKVVAHDGELVAKGQIIGYSGATGEATGPHLHYEVRVDGHSVPPMKYTR